MTFEFFHNVEESRVDFEPVAKLGLEEDGSERRGEVSDSLSRPCSILASRKLQGNFHS